MSGNRADDHRAEERRLVPLEPGRDFDSPLHGQGVFLTGHSGVALVSGQVGVRPDGTSGSGLAEQTRIAFENIARILAEADLDLPDVASLRIYLTSPDHIEAFTAVARQCLDGHRPAATLLIVHQLANPALLVQIEAVAAR